VIHTYHVNDSFDFKSEKDFAVAVMTNGFNSIGGTRVEDIVEEYQIYAKKHLVAIYVQTLSTS
jgi:hypothetical protein